jgi:hypothetical protein
MTIILKPQLEEEKKKMMGIFSQGAFVPMHMISYLTYEIKPLASPIPDIESPDLVKN